MSRDVEPCPSPTPSDLSDLTELPDDFEDVPVVADHDTCAPSALRLTPHLQKASPDEEATLARDRDMNGNSVAEYHIKQGTAVLLGKFSWRWLAVVLRWGDGVVDYEVTDRDTAHVLYSCSKRQLLKLIKHGLVLNSEELEADMASSPLNQHWFARTYSSEISSKDILARVTEEELRQNMLVDGEYVLCVTDTDDADIQDKHRARRYRLLRRGGVSGWKDPAPNPG